MLFFYIKINIYFCKKKHMSILSKNLIKYRKLIKKSQKEVSELIGIEQATYSKWESGASVKSDFIPKLASLFEIEISELFEEKKKNNEIINFKKTSGNSKNTGYVFVINNNESFQKIIEFIHKNIENE